MISLHVRIVNPAGQEQIRESSRGEGRVLNSLVVCPTHAGPETTPRGAAGGPSDADINNLATLEILPGHQPFCAVLPPGTAVYALYSPEGLPKRELSSSHPDDPTIARFGGMLHTRTSFHETNVNIILFGE